MFAQANSTVCNRGDGTVFVTTSKKRGHSNWRSNLPGLLQEGGGHRSRAVSTTICRATPNNPNGARPPAVQENTGVHVKMINNVKYVTLEQARAMVDDVSAARQKESLAIQDKLNLLQSLLDGAVSDRERLDRELRRAQQDQVAKDKRIKSEVQERLSAIKTVGLLRSQLEELEAKQALLQEEKSQAAAKAAAAEAAVADAAAKLQEQKVAQAAADAELAAKTRRTTITSVAADSASSALTRTASTMGQLSKGSSVKKKAEGVEGDQEDSAATAAAVLAAGEAIEKRLKLAYEKQYSSEIAVLKEQLRYAMEIANKFEAEAAAAKTDADMRAVQATEDALDALELESETELQLAKLATDNAREAALASSLAARTALEGQEEALAAAKAIREQALETNSRALEYQAEAKALESEVEALRQKLEETHQQAAEAMSTAAQLEKDSLERASAAEAAAQQRLDEALAAFQTLRNAAEARANEAEQRSEQYKWRITELSGEIEVLRKELAVAQEAVAQASARSEQLEADLQERLAVYEQQAGDAVEQERKLLEATKARLQINTRDLVVAELDAVMKEVDQRMEEVQASARGQMLSLQRALRTMTKERDYWKRRGAQLERDIQAVRLATQQQLQKQATEAAVEVPAAKPAPKGLFSDGLFGMSPKPAAKTEAQREVKNAATTAPAQKGRLQNAMPQRKLWEFWAVGSNTQKDEPAMQDLPTGEFHDDEDEAIKKEAELAKSLESAQEKRDGKSARSKGR